uniref:Uncharacterized protein n=1 Tax=Periophthalmus magnuspinnatus TaxID=409849 RepID=A0A3B4BAV6_9GOBI
MFTTIYFSDTEDIKYMKLLKKKKSTFLNFIFKSSKPPPSCPSLSELHHEVPEMVFTSQLTQHQSLTCVCMTSEPYLWAAPGPAGTPSAPVWTRKPSTSCPGSPRKSAHALLPVRQKRTGSEPGTELESELAPDPGSEPGTEQGLAPEPKPESESGPELQPEGHPEPGTETPAGPEPEEEEEGEGEAGRRGERRAGEGGKRRRKGRDGEAGL